MQPELLIWLDPEDYRERNVFQKKLVPCGEKSPRGLMLDGIPEFDFELGFIVATLTERQRIARNPKQCPQPSPDCLDLLLNLGPPSPIEVSGSVDPASRFGKQFQASPS